MLLYLLITVGMLVCAVQAFRAPRLLITALWLAGTSALTAILMYLLGAPEIAVIELSVGAGLVTVLFVFAINIAGEEPLAPLTVIPRWLSWLLVIVAVVLLGYITLPALNFALPEGIRAPISSTIWKSRSLDVLLQIALIFSGVLGVLGLLSEGKPGTRQEEQP